MNSGMRAATAVGVGYLLGRRKKFRTATLMAAATAVGGTTVGGLVLRRGMKMLGNTEAIGKVAPQLGELADTVRGDLLSAGKAAATAAVSSRVDALTDSIHDRAERVRNPDALVEEGAGQAAETGRAASRAGRRAASGAGGATRRAAGRGRPTSRAVHGHLAGHAAEARLHPPQSPQLSGDQRPMMLNAAYLVDATAGTGFASEVAAAADEHPDLELNLTGPWPPYSFAGDDEGPAPAERDGG